MVENWRTSFPALPVREKDPEYQYVWHWKSEDDLWRAHALMENADLTIHFSSKEIELEGVLLNIQLGLLSEKITLRRVSASEIYAKVAVAPQYRKGDLRKITIELA